ncbi:2343_t:CDS:2 [Gigaspora rosea]|nr:2343_t:CDS:2 [Gigaspora rosea]
MLQQGETNRHELFVAVATDHERVCRLSVFEFVHLDPPSCGDLKSRELVKRQGNKLNRNKKKNVKSQTDIDY